MNEDRKKRGLANSNLLIAMAITAMQWLIKLLPAVVTR